MARRVVSPDRWRRFVEYDERTGAISYQLEHESGRQIAETEFPRKTARDFLAFCREEGILAPVLTVIDNGRRVLMARDPLPRPLVLAV